MPDIEELEIIWIPEEESKHVFVEEINGEEIPIDLPTSTIDRICTKKFGHTNWVRMGAVLPEELHHNPHEIDYIEGIVYFKHSRVV
jgi:hypothetical protein|tara:strand:- start:1219 stop:1476 length:258 start_codon:yes stop_codon:yes gene_type:complete